jgi:hypothetical protein
MIKHLVSIGQEELREELALLARLNRAVLNFSPRHGASINARYKRTFFLDQAFCSQLGFHADEDDIVVGLPSQEYDMDVFDAFSKIQSSCGFLVHPLEYLFLVTRAGDLEARESNIIAIALPLPKSFHDNLARIGKITFVKMNYQNKFSPVGATTETSFVIEVRRDKKMFWEKKS